MDWKRRIPLPAYAVFVLCVACIFLSYPLYRAHYHGSVFQHIKNETHKFVVEAVRLGQSYLINQEPDDVIPSNGSSISDMRNDNSNGANDVEKPEGITAVMFTTWVQNPEKTQVRMNALRTWRLWSPNIVPVLFSDDVILRKEAKQYGWGFQSEPRKGCSGIPLYREMFRLAIKTHDSLLYGFVNGDILVGEGLLPSLRAVTRMPSIHTKPVMVIIRRYNVKFNNRPPVMNVDNLTSIAKEGRAMTDGSSDGIFTNRLFPWDHVPDIVPGRLGIAMWMVSYAREMGADVIDISDTTVAVHMSTTAGHSESWHYKDRRCNHKIYEAMDIRPQSWFCGFIQCAAFKTVRVTRNDVTEIQVVDKRANNRVRCGECHMNLKPLLNTTF